MEQATKTITQKMVEGEYGGWLERLIEKIIRRMIMKGKGRAS